jgi:hypothetical protein
VRADLGAALGDRRELTVKRPIAAAGRMLPPGTQVAVAWEPEHARVFPAG